MALVMGKFRAYEPGTPDALAPFACAPGAEVPVPATLTRVVVPARRSRTKTSGPWLVSPGTRFVASE